jgi:hypothetical protein
MILPIVLTISQTFTPGAIEVQCGPFKEIVKTVMGKFKEEPLWIGNNSKERTNIVIFTNKETKTYTVIKYDEKDACVIDVGDSNKEMNDKVMRLY